MPPLKLVPLSGRYLTFDEREEIAIPHAQNLGVRQIAWRVGRSPSTISRELRRNASTRGNELTYRASTAQWHAERRASRPKVAKLAANDRLRAYVQDRLAGTIARPDGVPVPGPEVKFIGRRHGHRADRRWAKAWSPEQIANRPRVDFPDDESMRISHEAIYQALYIQGRGALKRELVACLRTGRALRVPRARTRGRGKKFVTPEIMISQRPAEVDDRAVPGHWEGDLILGLNRSAIGTLVERTTRFTMLLHLPPMDSHGEQPRRKNGPPLAGHGAQAVRDEIARVDRHPARSDASLTDLGPRRGDGPTRPAADRHGPGDLLLRPPVTVAAQRDGIFAEEIVPVTVRARGSETVVDTDEHPRADTTLERLAGLTPIMHRQDPDATVTAGNASGQNDAAALCIVTTPQAAERHDLTPLVRLVSSAAAGCDPRTMGLGPVPATSAALERAGLTLTDMDLIELNEAFAAQALGVLRTWELDDDLERVNVHGSGISLGHPVGATGARILTTLSREMARRGACYGLETMCIGGGQGLAAVFERV